MIRSIATPYRGTVFASTLEADWAKTLDGLRIAWQYEPEGVKLPDGQNYRPDFYLPHLTTWLEVKGPHNARIDKPARLARALMHAPGCKTGKPDQVASRPSGLQVASCACGFGPDYPHQLVIVGRPATAGKLTFEPPRGVEADLVLLSCPVCDQHSFIDARGLHVCRRCRQGAVGGSAWPSGRVRFARIDPPRGGRRGSLEGAT